MSVNRQDLEMYHYLIFVFALCDVWTCLSLLHGGGANVSGTWVKVNFAIPLHFKPVLTGSTTERVGHGSALCEYTIK